MAPGSDPITNDLVDRQPSRRLNPEVNIKSVTWGWSLKRDADTCLH
jgi:hypothetical protein